MLDYYYYYYVLVCCLIFNAFYNHSIIIAKFAIVLLYCSYLIRRCTSAECRCAYNLQDGVRSTCSFIYLSITRYCTYIIFHILVIVLIAGTVESCTEGFMSHDLLTAKAEQITSSLGLSVTTLAESRPTRWIFGSGFRSKSSCSNSHVITGLTLGVDIRTVTESRNEYPLFEIWRRDSNSFNKQQNISVALTPANFSTNGTYRFMFPTPISFNSSTRLGIYQPANENSVVRFYTISQSIDILRVKNADINNDPLASSTDFRTQNFFNVIMHPITG